MILYNEHSKLHVLIYINLGLAKMYVYLIEAPYTRDRTQIH
jgi:hypothetical protein